MPQTVNSSIKKYPGVENVDFVVCQVCKQRRGILKESHIKAHGLSVEEYRNKFPDAKFVSEKSSVCMSHPGNIITPSQKEERLEQLKKTIEMEGYTYISGEYVGAKSNILVKCPEGHTVETNQALWKQGCRCRTCSLKKRDASLRLDFPSIKEEFEKEGYTLLTTEYITCSQKLEYICPEGHKHSISWDQWKAGQRCRKCGILGRADKQRFDIKYVRDKIEEFGYKLISEVYEGANKKLQIECPVGHVFSMTYGNWSMGNRCPLCAYKIRATKTSTVFDIIKQAFENEGYNLLSKDYVNRVTPLDFVCKRGHRDSITWASWLKGSRCNQCGYLVATSKRILDYEYVKNGFEKYGYKLLDKEYVDSKKKLKVLCPEGHEFETIWNIFQQGHRCPICSKRHSKPEVEIYSFIKKEFEDTISGCRKIIYPFELDIVIPSKKFAIEYCGLYWHMESGGKGDKYHINKLNMCNEKGYRLITIFEDEYIHHKEVVLNTLLAKLGVSKAEKINARDCEIREIDTSTASDFCNRFHLQGYTGASIKLGAFLGTKLLSVMTFSRPSVAKGGKAEDGVFELSRFCSDFQFRLVGGAGKLLKHFCREEEPNQIFTYADRRWSDGTLYEKIGFQKIGNTQPNYWYIHRGKRLHRFNFRKSELVDFPNYSSDKTEMQIMDEAGFGRMYDCGNLKYVYSYH